MEYPSKNDIYLVFKALYNEKEKFSDYILINSSYNFHNVFNHKINSMIGKKLSEIITEDKEDELSMKVIYYHMIPKARRKFEVYNADKGRWYLINIFGNEKDELLLFYTDITKYKIKCKKPQIKSYKEYRKQERRCV